MDLRSRFELGDDGVDSDDRSAGEFDRAVMISAFNPQSPDRSAPETPSHNSTRRAAKSES
jgi:hypothetical protein